MNIDIFKVNEIPLFLSKTVKMNFLSGAKLKSRSGRETTNAINRYRNKHGQRGFEITDMHGDNKFNIHSLQVFLQPINIHMCATNEHIGFIDNTIKTIKERARLVCHTALYR